MSAPLVAVPGARPFVRPSFELADIVRFLGQDYLHSRSLCAVQARALRDIERCRTPALGGHLDVCEHCGHAQPSYNSCRNRHCPKCQGIRRAQWVADRMDQILPTPYFHTVVTVAHELHPLFRAHPARLYGLFFHAVSCALQELCADPKYIGGQVGSTAVLHTWTQEMKLHVHLHLVVTAGGLDPCGSRWIPCRRNFLVPNRALAKLVRGKLCDAIAKTHEKDPLRLPDSLAAPDAFRRLLRKAHRKKWIAYSKPPFAGPEHVFLYLGQQYTHRVAISNHRLIGFSEGEVTFSARDNENPGARRRVTLPAGEFLDRFLLHVLPDGFVRIRHYGLLASRNLPTKLPLARQLLESRAAASGTEALASPKAPRPRSWQVWLEHLTGIDPTRCPRCKTATLARFPLPRVSPESTCDASVLRAAHDTS
jgi:hypothetical protein